MDISINIYVLQESVNPETATADEIHRKCGNLLSSSTFSVNDDFANDTLHQITQNFVFERIELLRILDEYIDDSLRETYKRDVLDNFSDGNTVATVFQK